ncbi:hypothetical protein Celaphus_00009782 [Cervus elaphus hippelaphus]|uniref:Uncharacterized protein n=1 Tax=Cervus elaphus hippelaphus TaxID=46360 RepID=A0A212C146_CEREH|nr:hypothetical protein Celaphus_00009782 [Cervus elaphus hippelaphus]
MAPGQDDPVPMSAVPALPGHGVHNMSHLMAPAKKEGEKKKGWSAINEVVAREYTINIHKRLREISSST